MKHNKKKLIPVVLLVIVTVAFGIYHFNNPARTGEIVLTGEIETTMVSNVTEVPGKILEIPIELGQPVKKGDIIAILDSSSQQYAIDQAELTIQKKKASLKELHKGADTEQIQQAQNSVSIAQSGYNSAKITADKAAEDYETALKLYNDGGIPKSTLDNAKLVRESTANAADAAKKQIDSASQQVSLLLSGAKDTTIESTVLDIAITESQLLQMKEGLEKYTIRAQSGGVIMSKNYTQGAMVAAGADLAVISSDAQKYLVVYVAKEDLHLVQYEQEVHYEAGDIQGAAVVKYIDVKSRYTPKDLQTAANKNKESMKVKMLLSDAASLIPGETMKVIIPIHEKE